MNALQLSLRDLEYLVAVAEDLHFGKAAAACHVSQPALSAQVKKAEDLLGIQVFERSKRHVLVTPQGEAIIAQARVVLDEARKLVELAQKERSPLSGAFRLGIIATLGPYLVPHILAPLRRQYPRLQLLLKEGLTAPLLAELKAGTLDAVLASDTFEDESLHSVTVFTEPFVIALPKGHPLTQKGALRPSDINAGEMVLLEEGHCLKDQALQVCPAKTRGSARQFHATSLETLRHLVASGYGYTLIPALAAQTEHKLNTLIQYRQFTGNAVGRRILLVSRKRFSGVADVEALSHFLKENVPRGLTP